MEQRLPTFHLDLDESLPKRGRLSQIPAYVILLWAGQRNFTGRIVFERDERIKHIYIRDGALAAARSNLVPEGLDHVLKKGFLPASDLLAVEGFSSRSPADEDWDASIAKRLRETGVLSANALDAALDLQIRDRVLNLAGWFDGTYAVQPGEIPSRDLLSVRPLPLAGFLGALERLLLAGADAVLPSAHLPSPGKREDLRSQGGAFIFSLFASHRATGRLTFTRGRRKKIFEWRNGVIVSASSSDPSETLGVTLRRWRYLQEEAVARLESAARAKGEKLREVLRKEKLLSEREISEVLTTLRSERILEAFSWRSGTYEYEGEFGAAPSPPRETTVSLSDLEERTEKDLLLIDEDVRYAGAKLSELSVASGNSFLLAEISPGESLLPRAEQLAELWGTEDLRTVIVGVGDSHDRGANPALWEETNSWNTHIVKKAGGMADYLPLASEDRHWRTSDGIVRLRHFAAALSSTYDRVLWLAPLLPQRGSPLLSAASHVIFVVTSAKTAREDLLRALERVPDERTAGFLFRKREQRDGWAGIVERLKPRSHLPA